jgi:hypothetical protein
MYYRTNEEAEVADALTVGARFAAELTFDVRMWRWVIIALHNGIQGFMVLSLRHGNGLLALTDESAAAWLEAYRSNAERFPDEQLESYLGLYKKIKHSKWGTIADNQRFVPQRSQGRSIRKLNRIRNEFSHFTPKGWSLELTGLPRICLDALAIVSFLGWETTNIHWHDVDCLARSKAAYASLSDTLTKLSGIYDKQAN